MYSINYKVYVFKYFSMNYFLLNIKFKNKYKYNIL